MYFPLNAPTTAVSNEIADITKDNYHFGKREEGRNSDTGEQTSALPGEPLSAQRPDPAPRVLGAPEAGLPVVCVPFQLGSVKVLL